MFLATEINHIKELCEKEDVNALVLSLLNGNLNRYNPNKLAQCMMLSPNLKQPSMEILLKHCEENGIYVKPQIKSVAMQRNENLSPGFLLEQEKKNVYHALINPNVPGEIAVSRAREMGGNYYFLLRNKNVTKDNSQGLTDNDFNAAIHHASGYGISKKQYIEYMEAFFQLKEKPSARIHQTSSVTLFSSPYFKDYLNHSELNLSEFILKFDAPPSSKTLCSIIDSDSIKVEDIISLITDIRIMQNTSNVFCFILESLQSSRYHLNEKESRDCLKSITMNIANLSPKDIGDLFGLHTYLILLNIDYGHYDDALFYEWAKQLENKTSLNQNLFTPEKEYGVITSSGDKTQSLINEIDNINPENRSIDIILESSHKHYPILSNNLTSLVLNKKIETKNINSEQENKKLTRFI